MKKFSTKKNQGLNGNLIQSKIIKSETNSKNFLFVNFFTFERLDLSYGWRAIENSKRAHYLDIIDDKSCSSFRRWTIYFLKLKILTKKN